MTDDLIARLSADLKPVGRHRLARILLVAAFLGAALAAMAMLTWLGLRGDLTAAMGGPIFWIKSGYTAAFAILGGFATLTLARPDGRIAWPWVALGSLVLLLIAAAAVQLWQAAPGEMSTLVLGGSSLVCPWYILALSLPGLAALLTALRRLAPRNPTWAGLAAGLLAGGTGAWVYSFHCGENGLMFLSLWYTLGMLAVAALGALLGRYLLRW